MSALSDYLENKLLDHLLKNTAYTQPPTLYFALFTADPGESGVTGELTIGTGAYARAAITNNNGNFPQCASSGTPTKTNGAPIQFPTATAAWGTVTHWAIYDVVTTGTNMLLHGALATPRYIATGDTPKIAAGAMSITITNATSGGMSAYAQRKSLDHILGGPTYTPAATVYTGIGTLLTGETLSEWTESSYGRRSTAFGSSAGGMSANTAIVTFTSSVLGATSTLNSFGVWDDPITGNLLFVGPVSTARTVNPGDTSNIAIGGFTATVQ